jgi:hypothetical protein
MWGSRSAFRWAKGAEDVDDLSHGYGVVYW